MPNMLDTLARSGQFKVFLEAVHTAGMEDWLRGEGPYTLFAPNDAAFKKLPHTTMRELMHNTGKLRQMIAFHLVQCPHSAEEVSESDELLSVQGEKLSINNSHKLSVEQATVIETDIECENGLIHVIDQVLTPKSVQVEVS